MVSSLGERLRYLRERKCLKQEDIAQYLKVSRTSISKYESGDREPDIDTVKALARFYNVPVDFIFGLTDSPYLSDKGSANSLENAGTFVAESPKITYEAGIEEFIKSADFLRLAKKIKENNLDIKTVETIIDNIILLNKSQSPPR